jgi:hypothetical protein
LLADKRKRRTDEPKPSARSRIHHNIAVRVVEKLDQGTYYLGVTVRDGAGTALPRFGPAALVLNAVENGDKPYAMALFLGQHDAAPASVQLACRKCSKQGVIVVDPKMYQQAGEWPVVGIAEITLKTEHFSPPNVRGTQGTRIDGSPGRDPADVTPIRAARYTGWGVLSFAQDADPDDLYTTSPAPGSHPDPYYDETTQGSRAGVDAPACTDLGCAY